MRAAILVLVAAAACAGRPRTDYLRVTTDDGRVFYARSGHVLHAESRGWITFRDLVSGEPVRLKDGTWESEFCTRHEVMLRQYEFLEHQERTGDG